MSVTKPQRGGAPVGWIAELGHVEAGAVLYFRLWCDGPDSQQQVWTDFARTLGADHGRAALKSLETLCRLCVEHGRRPLMRHSVGCSCLGGDEACFANLVAAATEGEREDAMLLATLIVRADIAPCLLQSAETFGLALRRIGISKPQRPMPSMATTIH